MNKRVGRYIRRKFHKKRWQQFAFIMACIVVFCTTYALLLPAVTLEKTADCGLEEHQHEKSCYQNQLVCGNKESDGPRHTDSCYQKVLVCGKEVHVHSEDCFHGRILKGTADENISADNTAEEAGQLLLDETEDIEQTAVNEPASGAAMNQEIDPETEGDGLSFGEEAAAESESVSEQSTAEEAAEEANPLLEETDTAGWEAEISEEQPADGEAAGEAETESEENAGEEFVGASETESEEPSGGETVEAETEPEESSGGETVETETESEEPSGEESGAAETESEEPSGEEIGAAEETPSSEPGLTEEQSAEEETAGETETFPEETANVETDQGLETLPEETSDEGTEPVEENPEWAAETSEDQSLTEDTVTESETLSEETTNEETRPDEENSEGEAEIIEEQSSAEETAIEIETLSEETAPEEIPDKEAGATTEQVTSDIVTEDGTEPAQEAAAQLACQGPDYEVTVTSGVKEGIPKDASLSVSEIMPETPADNTDADNNTDTELTYEEYVSRTEEALGIEKDSGYFIRLFDIKIVDAYGEKIKIQVPVNVKIRLTDQKGADISNAQVVHFADETKEADIAEETNGTEKPDSETLSGSETKTATTPSRNAEAASKTKKIKKAAKAEKKKKEKIDKKGDVIQDVTVEAGVLPEDGTTLSFETEGFSVFALVGTTIEKTVLASDGHNYRITATYGAETGIPEDADLAVEEITEVSSDYEKYVSKTENALGMEEGSAGYIRLFDIKIVDKNNPEVKYQPVADTTVDVRIELADSEGKDLSLVHFADDTEEGEKIECRTEAADNGQSVSFAADGFSVYAIVEGDQSTGETYSIKYIFVLEDGTPFYFTNINGDTTNVQYVKDGEIPINPGTPTVSTGEQADKEFAGWWTKNGTAWGTELSFDTPVSTSSLQEITVYARYDNTQYITYYDENGTVYLVDRRHENDTVLTTDVKNPATGEKWTEQELEDYRFVSYLPLSKTTAFLGWTQTQGKTTPDDNFTITEATTLYPVIAEVKWVTYHSGPTGSNATYFGAEYALDGNWDRNNLADHIPTRAGYQFDGWYIRNTATQGDNDNLDYSWTLSSADVRVTDANGNFDNSFKNNSAYFENGKLKNDIELVAHWTPTTVNYVFVYYQQEPNANDDGSYDYVYKDSQTASGIAGTNTGTPPVPAWNDINGFSLHNTSDSEDPYNVKTQVIEGDGSTVVNVYYDRNEYTIVFLENKRSTGYVVDESSSNNIYGWDGNEYVPLNQNSITRYYYTYDTGGWNSQRIEYTGTFYTRKDNGYWANPRYTYNATEFNGNNLPNNNATYYTSDEKQLTRRSETISSWMIAATGQPYTGTRFRKVTSNTYGWFVIDELTIKAKYGEDVSQLWPDKRADLSTDYPMVWKTEPDGYTMQSGIGIMAPINQVFYKYEASGSAIHLKYYLQNLPSSSDIAAPNTFSIIRDDVINYNGTLNTTWQDYSVYEGFTINAATQQNANTINDNKHAIVATCDRSFTRSIQIGAGINSNNPAEIYYLRNKYSINFQQGNTVIASDEYYYEADISNADKYSSAVNVPAGMRFVGWYDNPEGLGEKYTFDGKTMPSNNLILYAKLVPEEYYVRLDYNGGETKGSESTFAWIDYGETIEEAEDVKRNYVAVADGETGTHNYVYWRYDEAADAAGDGWWSYYLDADGNVVYNDPKDYSQRTAAYIEAAGGKYKYDPSKYTFIGWYETDEAGNQISNVPFNFATQITKDTYLKAIFRKEGTFQVRYLPNMGIEGTEGYVAGNPNTAPPTDAYTYIDLSEAKVGHSIEPADEKFQFAGWRVKGTTGPIYQPGETFPINSDYAKEDNNIQYITLEPVFIQKGDTSITYEVNTPTGGTATGTNLTDLTNNTQEKLILDGSVTLHDGEGFAVTGYKLIGWSDKPLQPSQNPIHLKDDGTYEGNIPSDTHIFKPGGKYGVSDEEGNTLYAVWELLTIPVPFTKKGENNLGEYEQLEGAQFNLYTDAACNHLISDIYNEINNDEAIVSSSDEAGNNVVFPKVPVGTFYFKETAVGNQYKLDTTVHTIVVSESDDGNHTLSYTIDETYSLSNPLVIRNYLKGTLVITKTVEAMDTTGTFSFTAVLSDTSINGKYGDLTFTNGSATFNLEHGSEKKIRNLVGKTITITENNAAAYTTTATAQSGSYNKVSKSYTITIPEDGDTVAFTNTLEARKLRIRKIGDDAPSGLAGAKFNLTRSGVEGFTDLTELISLDGAEDPANLGYLPSGDETDNTLFTLPIGNYTLTETNAPQYYNGISGAVSLSVTDEEISIVGVGTDMAAPFDGVTISGPGSDGAYTLNVTNTHKKATVKIIKNVNGTNADKDAEYSFTAMGLTATQDSFKLHGRQIPDTVEEGTTPTQENTKVYTNVPHGTVFSVTESSTSTDFDTTIAISNEETPVTTSRLTTGNVTVDGDVTITYTNTRNKQPVKVFKFETGTSPEKPLSDAVFSLTGPEGSDISYTDLTTNSDGYLVHEGGIILNLPVNSGTYTLTETQAPAGYQIIGDGNTTFTVSSNLVTGSGVVAETKLVNGEETPTGVFIIKVQNSAGIELPSTGGPGTSLIYLLGIMLTGFAGTGLVMRKRGKAA